MEKEFLILINIIAFITFGIDKYKAVHHKWRIRENTLFLLAIIGGGLGALLGMHFFHHKTKHNSFKYGIPFILMIWIILIILKENSQFL
ncbi:Uncharacterized membrane protein YsdA, DUF1294 family [Kandleria vitulina]|uniref:DUF1294 domain-containing protein n=1 Tax=Kandleria vitulina TaxID=1630 RepID=UPI00087E10BA|nr:DUF1294 domain-containing protein [Kandleria vitulina]SDL96299.1 Uncharacterized membrane protein YsdA, DUF1294 family [Kandleria vitulina]SEJ01406.1 Uncharacterized membrane protein YsdA, DUF1294 family [Kandleria vitulina]